MLNKDDKKWIDLKIDGRINQAKFELRDDILASEARLEGKIDDVEARLESKIDDVEARLENKIDESGNKLMAYMETEFRHYMKIVNECMPDSVRSYEKIENTQHHHESDLAVLKTAVSNHESRISRLERT